MDLASIHKQISQANLSQIINNNLPYKFDCSFRELKIKFKSNSPDLIKKLVQSFSFFLQDSQTIDLEILVIENGPLSSWFVFATPFCVHFIYKTDNGIITVYQEKRETKMAYLGTSPRLKPPLDKVNIIDPGADIGEMFFLADFLATTAIAVRIDQYLFFHAACLAWRKQGVILAGETMSGKTTLSLSLAGAGLDFLSDEVTCLDIANHKLTAFPKIVCLRKQTLSFFKPVSNTELYRDSGGEERWLVRPTDLDIEPVAESCLPKYFFLLKGFKKRAVIKPAKPREALWYALSSSYAPISDAPRMLLALGPAFDRMECYNLWPGRVEETLEMIRGLICREKRPVTAEVIN